MLAIVLCLVVLIFLSAFDLEEEDINEEYSYNTVFPENYTHPENPKMVYLTFDDGPTEYTPQIIDILNQHHVPATFFVVGDTGYTHHMRMIVENGHAIGLHSYNHDFEQIYRSSEAFFNDLQKIDDIVFNETGVRSMIIRFPGGSSVTRGATKSTMNRLKIEVIEKGYQYFDWNCDSSDSKGAQSASGAFSNIKSREKEFGDIVIVLMHDTKKITVEYLPRVIEYFKTLGYDFLPLSLDAPAIHHTW